MDFNVLFDKALEFFETGIEAHKAAIAGYQSHGAVAAEPTPKAPAKTEEPTGGWNPLTEKVQGKYGKDKQDIMDAYIKEHGIKVSDKATGAEKHTAILDYMKTSGALEGSTDQEIVEENTPPAADDDFGGGDEDFGGDDAPAKKYTKEEVRAALFAFRDKMAKGATDDEKKTSGNAAVRELLTKVAGTHEFNKIADEQYPAVMKALGA